MPIITIRVRAVAPKNVGSTAAAGIRQTETVREDFEISKKVGAYSEKRERERNKDLGRNPQRQNRQGLEAEPLLVRGYT